MKEKASASVVEQGLSSLLSPFLFLSFEGCHGLETHELVLGFPFGWYFDPANVKKRFLSAWAGRNDQYSALLPV